MPKIIFNENFGVDEITILLERRDFHKYGKLIDATDIEYKDTLMHQSYHLLYIRQKMNYGIKLTIIIWYIFLSIMNIFLLL